MFLRVIDELYSKASTMIGDKWFIVNFTVLGLDIISILIDGLFYKALREAPQEVLLRDDANELKTPVLVFIIFVCIIQLINIVYTIYKHLYNGGYNLEQKD